MLMYINEVKPIKWLGKTNWSNGLVKRAGQAYSI
jgi:hypothetical protein